MEGINIALISLLFLAIGVFGEVQVTNTATNSCPKDNSVYPERPNNDAEFCGKPVKSLRSDPVTYQQMSGTWYALRIGPSAPGTENMEAECWTETYYRSEKSNDSCSPPSIIALVQMKMNGKWELVTSPGTYLTPVSQDGKGEINPRFRFVGETPEKFEADCILEGTDHGKSWLVWNCCMEFVPGNKTSIWILMGRLPYMDSKLEQDLVEEIEQASGLSQKALRGMRQLGCRD